jgi:hypothetical protein
VGQERPFPDRNVQGDRGRGARRPTGHARRRGQDRPGIFFHFFISFAFTLLFFLLFPRVSLCRGNRDMDGTVYALVVWTITTYAVLPLSALPWSPPDLASKQLYLGVAIFVPVFGLPITFDAARFYQRYPRET